LADVVAEHPEGWPNACSCGDLDACLDATVLEALQAFGGHPRGGPFARCIAASGDVEISVGNNRVWLCGIAGRLRGGWSAIGLKFVVSPAVSSGLEGPVRRIGSCAWTGELVGPDEMFSVCGLRVDDAGRSHAEQDGERSLHRMRPHFRWALPMLFADLSSCLKVAIGGKILVCARAVMPGGTFPGGVPPLPPVYYLVLSNEIINLRDLIPLKYPI
jgi:hypothetical protein